MHISVLKPQVLKTRSKLRKIYIFSNREEVLNMVMKIWNLYYEDGYDTKEIAKLVKINETFVVSVLGL